jgi:hypothetical protein
MFIKNLDDVNNWLEDLNISKHRLYRFKEFPTTELDIDWIEELVKHARNYLNDNSDLTFHHIRLLFKKLKNEKIQQPLVGTIHNNHINVNPGGSRLMVAKKLDICSVPLDLICTKEEEQFINFSLEHEHITSVDQFLKPYKQIKSDASFQFVDTDGGYPVIFWYQVNYDDHWHWNDKDVQSWIIKNKDVVCKNLIDYYFL